MTQGKSLIDDCIQASDLGGALRESAERVRTRPQDEAARVQYIDLLIADGDFVRADKQAEILSTLAPKLALGLTTLRGLLRAEDARKAWFERDAAPIFPEGPTERDKAMIALHLELRIGGDGELYEKTQRAQANSGCGPAIVNGEKVDILRDIDDRIPHALEALYADGGYRWLDFTLLRRIEFEPVECMRDLIWRTARITLRSGTFCALTIPATYFAPNSAAVMKLARETDWRPLKGGLFAGVGQKCLLAGEEAIGLLDVETIEFD